MPDNPYSESFTVRAYETRPDGYASLPSLCNYLQEVASNHAELLDFSFEDLAEQNLLWVLHRLTLKMTRYPKWREQITVETWPSGSDKLRAYRDFIIRDAAGEAIGVCVSYWMMINFESRRPTRIPQSIHEHEAITEEHTLPLAEERVAVLDEPTHTAELEVRFSDLDLNNHANNAKYVEWMLEAYPNDLLRNHLPIGLDIEFLGECRAGESLTSAYRTDRRNEAERAATHLHAIHKEGARRPIASGEITMQRIEN